MSIVYVDIETTTWFDQVEVARLPRDLQVCAMAFAIGVTWDSNSDSVKIWHDAGELFDYLLQFEIVAGWNVVTFDIPILAREAGASCLGFPQVYDLFDIIKRITGRWYKLDDVARATLGRGKTADGLQAAKWLAEGGEENTRKAIEYCKVDIELERELGEMARRGVVITLPGLKREDQKKPLSLVIDLGKRAYRLSGEF